MRVVETSEWVVDGGEGVEPEHGGFVGLLYVIGCIYLCKFMDLVRDGCCGY